MCNGFFFMFLLCPCAWFNFHQSPAQSVMAMNVCSSASSLFYLIGLIKLIFLYIKANVCVCVSVCMYVPLFPSSLRIQQLKQVQLVTLLKPLHNNGIVRHC
jgi:hypothetical protein